MFKPEGVYAALILPFMENGNINQRELRQIIEFQIEKGIDGIFPNSSVGEFVHLEPEQRNRLNKIVMDQVKGRVPVIAGISATTPAQSIEMGEYAEQLGCQAGVVMPPYFYPVSQDTIEEHFTEIEAGLGLPIVLYNIPKFTTGLSYRVFERLCRLEGIVGMKESSGSMIDFVNYLNFVESAGKGANFSLLVGREEMFFPALMAGGKGAITCSSGVFPEVIGEIYRQWQQENYQKARQLQFRLLPLIRLMNSLPFPAGFKLAMEIRGFDMGPNQQPLSKKDRQRCSRLRPQLKELISGILSFKDRD